MKTIRTPPLVTLFALTSIAISGCDENKDMKSWADDTARLRGAAEEQIPNTPYRKQQHVAFKAYYSELGQMALALRNDETLRARFNQVVSQNDMNALCKKIFSDRDLWNKLVQSCTKNRFFLCAEEVRAYPDFVRGIRAALLPELQRKFDQSGTCKSDLLR